MQFSAALFAAALLSSAAALQHGEFKRFDNGTTSGVAAPTGTGSVTTSSSPLPTGGAAQIGSGIGAIVVAGLAIML